MLCKYENSESDSDDSLCDGDQGNIADTAEHVGDGIRIQVRKDSLSAAKQRKQRRKRRYIYPRGIPLTL